jgi:translin
MHHFEMCTVVYIVSLKSLLKNIQEELMKKDEVRQELQRDMRKATRLSKQAILFTHQERFDEAKKLLAEANKLITKLNDISKDHPELVYTGLVNAAFEEYTEAHAFILLIKEDRFISPEELGVPSVSYVLGLADVVGEFRRRALDSIRRGDVETAEKSLQIMEQIYVELTAMDDTFLLVSALRRKCDVARRLIEITRGDVTIETRRSSLERSIKELEKTLRRKTKVGKSEN